MAYEFNLFDAALPTSSTTSLRFAAGPDMEAGSEIWIEGSGLSHDPVTGTISGVITQVVLVDGDGDVDQTIAIAPANQAGLAASVSAFLGEALGVMADTFAPTAWDLVGDGALQLGEPIINSDTDVILPLQDGIGNLIGSLRFTGTGFINALTLPGIEYTASITQIQNLDINGDPIVGEVVNYPGGVSLSAFSYGLLSVAGVTLGNQANIYKLFVDGGVTITKNDAENYAAFEGGAGNDVFVSNTGGAVIYESASEGMTIDLGAGTASATANPTSNSDSWAPGSLGAAYGSNFDDIISGSTLNSILSGGAGNDVLTGFGQHDRLIGGAGNDTLTAGDGDDWIAGGAGNDSIVGGENEGSDTTKGSNTFYEDVLTYTQIVANRYDADIPGLYVGETDTGGITVVYTGDLQGTVTGPLAGTDTFAGIETVLGSSAGDTFDASGTVAGDLNIFDGMEGNDSFTGGAGFETVSYYNQLYDAARYPQWIQGLIPLGGAFVNLSNVDQTVAGITALAQTAFDSYTNIDSFLGDIDGVDGTYFSDALIGNALGNILIGNEGGDLLVGREGNDTIVFGFFDIIPGSASDYVDYRRDGGAGAISVTIDELTGVGSVTDTHGDLDEVHGFGTYVGTDLGDTFVGTTFTDRFAGGRGNDSYTSNGGSVAGGDQISYLYEDGATLGIDFDATRLSGQIKTNDLVDTFWGTDELIGFTSIWLEATQNSDVLVAGGGDDVLLPSHGVDSIDGGGGIDALSYVDFRTSLTGNGVVYAATTGTSGTVTDGNGDTDTYTNIEILAGSMLDDVFNGSTGDDILLGHGGNDVFDGNGGFDTITYEFDPTLAAGLAIDLLLLHIDTGPNLPDPGPHGIFADLAAGTIVGLFENLNTLANEDTDTVIGINNVAGTIYADSFTGNDFDNTFTGFDGNDTFTGALGNDEFFGGIGADQLFGEDGNDILRGEEGTDTIVGGAGSDELHGGSGTDSMAGGAGNDTYFVNETTDIVSEIASTPGNADLIRSRVNITALATDVEHLDLRTVADGFVGTGVGTGNSLNNRITGNELNNLLSGLGGTDTLIGGAGNDTFVVDAATDAITETAGQGTADRVRTSTNYTLAAAAHVEFLETTNATGTAALTLTGNALLAQTITGNAGANTLNGGTDLLVDTLIGLGGNDTYIINTGTDIITEVAGGGTADRARTSVSFTLAADDNIEFLETTNAAATTALTLTGNALLQTVTGNAGGNTLSGGTDGVADTLVGLAGNDTYIINTGTDIITEAVGGGTGDRARASVTFTLAADDNIEFLETTNAAGTGAFNLTGNDLAQTITGNAGNNTLTGKGGGDTIVANAGIDKLVGGLGLDTLTGGGGNDTFLFDTAAATATNRDRITDFSPNVAGNNDILHLDNAVFAKLGAAGALNAGFFRVGAAAADANDYLVYNQATGILSYDADGNGAGAAVQIAFFSSAVKPTLALADFLVV